MTTETLERPARAERGNSTLRMVQLRTNEPALHRWMADRNLMEETVALHHLLVQCMGDLSPRPFRKLSQQGDAQGRVLGYTTRTVEEIALEVETYADPQQQRIILLETLESKEMPSEWRVGRELGFEVRTRPVIRPQRRMDRVTPQTMQGHLDGRLRAGLNCDVLTWEQVLRQGTDNPEPALREEVYPRWMADRLNRQGGAEADPAHIRLDGFRLTAEVGRKSGARGWMLPDAVMRGRMTVKDPVKFRELLELGIGRHRAYGFGMVLLKPDLRG